MRLDRFLTALNTFVSDLRGSVRLAADTRSRLRLSIDFALSRFMCLFSRDQRKRLREIRLRGDIKIRYRLNKGDLHGRYGSKKPTACLLDLGASIGMTSLWLSKKLSFTKVIAVEPDPNNELVRQNLELNGISGQVLNAAIGPREGTARFSFSELSNLGRLSGNDSLVPMISVDTIIKKFAVTRFALVKIDIEGGEQELFDGPTAWLARTDAVVIEFHPTIVDYPRLTKLVSSNGFRYLRAHSFGDNMDCFTRVE